jgi:tetratricopeptide (TPR) repeat protein
MNAHKAKLRAHWCMPQTQRVIKGSFGILHTQMNKYLVWILIAYIASMPLTAVAQDQALITAADSSFAAADYAQLITDCDVALAEFPDTAFLYYYRGLALSFFGNDAAAMADLNKAISLEATFPEPFLARARIHYARGDREQAHKDIRQCLKRDAGMREAYLLRAEIYLDEGVLGEAWNDLETARRMVPRDPEVYCLRSEYYLMYGDAAKAVKEAGTAIKLAPDDALGYVAQAMAFEALGDFVNAKSDIDFAIQLEPQEYSLLNTRAMILDAMGDREAALKDLERYIAKDSLAWDAYFTRAWFSMQDSAWQAAEQDLFAAQRLQPEESSIPDQLGYLYLLMGEYAKAKAVLDSLVIQDSENAFARANLGYARLQLGDPDGALKDIQQAIKLDDLEPRAYFYRSAVYHALKKPTKACEDLQTAEELGFIDYYGEAELKAMKKKACD